jgi:hypothetical protein
MLVNAKRKEKHKNIHSNVSVINNDKPIEGNITTNKGKTEQ